MRHPAVGDIVLTDMPTAIVCVELQVEDDHPQDEDDRPQHEDDDVEHEDGVNEPWCTAVDRERCMSSSARP